METPSTTEEQQSQPAQAAADTKPALFDIKTATIEEWKKDFLILKIKDIDDKDTAAIVREKRLLIKNTRISIEKKAKELQQPLKEKVKQIADEAKALIGQMDPIEEYLEKEEDAYKLLVDAEKNKKAEQQRARIQARGKHLVDLGMKFDGLRYYMGIDTILPDEPNEIAITFESLTAIEDAEFYEFLEQVQIHHNQQKERKEQEEAAEKKRQADIQAENERLRKEAELAKDEAERAKLAAEEAAVTAQAMKEELEKTKEDYKLMESGEYKFKHISSIVDAKDEDAPLGAAIGGFQNPDGSFDLKEVSVVERPANEHAVVMADGGAEWAGGAADGNEIVRFTMDEDGDGLIVYKANGSRITAMHQESMSFDGKKYLDVYTDTQTKLQYHLTRENGTSTVKEVDPAKIKYDTIPLDGTYVPVTPPNCEPPAGTPVAGNNPVISKIVDIGRETKISHPDLTPISVGTITVDENGKSIFLPNEEHMANKIIADTGLKHEISGEGKDLISDNNKRGAGTIGIGASKYEALIQWIKTKRNW